MDAHGSARGAGAAAAGPGAGLAGARRRDHPAARKAGQVPLGGGEGSDPLPFQVSCQISPLRPRVLRGAFHWVSRAGEEPAVERTFCSVDGGGPEGAPAAIGLHSSTQRPPGLDRLRGARGARPGSRPPGGGVAPAALASPSSPEAGCRFGYLPERTELMARGRGTGFPGGLPRPKLSPRAGWEGGRRKRGREGGASRPLPAGSRALDADPDVVARVSVSLNASPPPPRRPGPGPGLGPVGGRRER